MDGADALYGVAEGAAHGYVEVKKVGGMRAGGMRGVANCYQKDALTFVR